MEQHTEANHETEFCTTTQEQNTLSPFEKIDLWISEAESDATIPNNVRRERTQKLLAMKFLLGSIH